MNAVNSIKIITLLPVAGLPDGGETLLPPLAAKIASARDDVLLYIFILLLIIREVTEGASYIPPFADFPSRRVTD